ncbi:MAG: radical SAM family heme chaperone HemW [Candidatus Babeliaceae bacterium]
MNFNNVLPIESLYIHWPFCPYKCHFCPFVALASHDHFMERYHDVLCREIEKFSDEHAIKNTINTIFLGGGTPSTYPVPLLLDLFDRLNKEFIVSPQAEISMEVNPGTVTLEKLQAWKQCGVNRLSIGVQSLKDDVLKKLNRHQSLADVEQLLDMASPLFSRISIDMILGLPDVSADEWKNMLSCVVAWPIQHISIYFLTIHEDTPLYFKVHQNHVSLPSDEAVVELYMWTINYLQDSGFYQYEVSNFARPGHESIHNQQYWNYKPYKGFGLGACSFDGTSRFQNQKNLMNYCQSIEQGNDITLFYETLTNKQRTLEKLMLGLRQKRGVCINSLFEEFTVDQQNKCSDALAVLYDMSLLRYIDGYAQLTMAGLAVENEVILRLSMVL